MSLFLLCVGVKSGPDTHQGRTSELLAAFMRYQNWNNPAELCFLQVQEWDVCSGPFCTGNPTLLIPSREVAFNGVPAPTWFCTDVKLGALILLSTHAVIWGAVM